MVSADSSPTPYATSDNDVVAATDMDLPTGDDISVTGSQTLDAPQPIVTSATGRIITVHTDVLEVKIDLVGGDVVGAALKNYPKTLDDPSDPFVLLERNATRTYVAQSGLVGPDGIDQKERATYRAERNVYELSGNEPLEVTIEHVGRIVRFKSKLFCSHQEATRSPSTKPSATPLQ